MQEYRFGYLVDSAQLRVPCPIQSKRIDGYGLKIIAKGVLGRKRKICTAPKESDRPVNADKMPS